MRACMMPLNRTSPPGELHSSANNVDTTPLTLDAAGAYFFRRLAYMHGEGPSFVVTCNVVQSKRADSPLCWSTPRELLPCGAEQNMCSFDARWYNSRCAGSVL